MGKVYLVGAGPGDEELLSVKARRLFETADVFVYDALVSTEILSMIPEEKKVIYVGKRKGNHVKSQAEIQEILLKETKKGNTVVRLKGGDPFVFGRGGEEALELEKEGVSFEIIPGVTSALAALAYAGIPVTHRDFASSFCVVTAHKRKEKDEEIDYVSLVRMGGTLVFLMGVSVLEEILNGLRMAGMAPDMPAAVVENGTTSTQRCILSTVESLTMEAKKAKIHAPAVIVVGEVCNLAKKLSWTKKRKLGGKKILVTRPRKRNEGLSSRLRSLGAQVIEFPTISLNPIEENEKLDQVLRTKEQRWYVFTSPEGVETFFAWLAERKMDIRHIWKTEDKLAVIGSATACELKKRGFFPDLMPKEYYAKDLGECLASAVKEGERVVLLRAREGSAEILKPLKEKEIPITDIPLYDTTVGGKPWLIRKIEKEYQTGTIDCVTFTSASTVKGFVKSFPGLDYGKIHAVCIGRKTKEEADRFGFLSVFAKEAKIDAVIDRILEI